MTDLRIDYRLLDDSSKTLGFIYDSFDHMKSRTSHTDSDWGSGEIRDAMHDFADNWDKHRHDQMKSIDAMKKMVDETLAGFRDNDGKLAGSLRSTTTHRSAGH